MSAPLGYRLVPLDCPSCGAALAAEGQDVVYYCTACRNGYLFDAEGGRLERVEVGFVAQPGAVAERHLPFWLLPARISIHERQSQSGNVTGLLASLFGRTERRDGVAADGTFAVPAFHLPLPETIELVLRYSRELPRLGERLGERLTGGCYGTADARKLAHFALIAAEARQPDTLIQLRYEIDFGPGRLLGVPFARRGEAWADSIFGLPATLG
jgi:hypothetical protein